MNERSFELTTKLFMQSGLYSGLGCEYVFIISQPNVTGQGTRHLVAGTLDPVVQCHDYSKCPLI